MDMIKNTVIRDKGKLKKHAGLADHERIIKFELTVNVVCRDRAYHLNFAEKI